ncbi:MAG: helix-turn-helix transcriptional regulator [Brevundimonas sp.]|uniref:helix-turn-helix domain-containing protein n=1 Tax=Brevundimonas sp. TaxID=1871086 RepID=UPI00182D19A6|nr:helix-turn-helix transcriptional regulator [Brevundimonas sp.]MBA4804783.1 helix-turn-helix transcriptional regulator [Brevundimonas sp.]
MAILPRSTFTDAYTGVLRTLVTARTQAGLTQAEVSRRLGKTQPFMSKVESGVRRIDVVEFCAIAAAIGHDPKVLFGEVADALPPRLEI